MKDFTPLDFLGALVGAILIWMPLWAGANAERNTAVAPAPMPAASAPAADQPPPPEPQAPTLTTPASPDAVNPPPT